LAAALSGYGGAAAFWVGDLSGRGRVVRTEPVLDPVWAPDGHVLAYEPGDNEVDVIAPSGKPLWHVLGDANFAAWSRQGRLAVRFHGETIRLYSERGRSLGS